jgi:hypothetical protein
MSLKGVKNIYIIWFFLEVYYAYNSMAFIIIFFLFFFFFFFFFFYSCCSHLEHRASMKCFVSLQFLNVRHSVGFLGRGISPLQGRYLTQTQNKRRDPCFECDLNRRSQRSSERRHFMPYSARPLWSAMAIMLLGNYLEINVRNCEFHNWK